MNNRAREKFHLFSHRALFEAKQKPFLIMAVLPFRSLPLCSRSTIWAHSAKTSLARLACQLLRTVGYSCDCRGLIQLNTCNFNSYLNKVRTNVPRKPPSVREVCSDPLFSVALFREHGSPCDTALFGGFVAATSCSLAILNWRTFHKLETYASGPSRTFNSS